ncbi:butyrophilin subfamily 2 member A2-like [Clupea harengus]|uniref:Butyrophilin subfamily 2 member A2-like n=1 Tax=Clupea harengus TaxID=7950 RepID=A0A8M1KQW1_CLUHA|nr:butyrophilin subfamily 2 member A2-like [Clupea harengus]
MEMTENILEEAQTYRVNGSPSDEDKSRDTNYDFSKDIKEAQSFKIFGFYKMAVVFLGLLCVLLSAVIVGLYIQTEGTRQFQLRYNNQTEEKDQQQMQYNNQTEEKDQLQMQYNKLNEEKGQLQMQYNKLNEEKGQLQMQYNKLNEEKSQLTAKFTTERDEIQRRLCKLESHDMKTIKQHAVDVTLDPDTASPYLTLSADGKQATLGPRREGVLKTSKRFWTNYCVQGKEGFSSGKFYYEVEVEITWYVGVVRESINRTHHITLSPGSGHWTQWEKMSTPKRVGIFVDYDAEPYHHLISPMISSQSP